MIFLYAYLLFTFGIWAQRAIRMIGSIQKYSCVPKRSAAGAAARDLVSLVVPCRNEEHNLDILIPTLLAQDYPNIEFLFLDDRSTDNTFQILEKYRARDGRIRVLRGKELPKDWTGKNHAIHQLAAASHGKWILETDADTAHDPHSVSSAVAYAESRNLDLLTLTARCVCKTFGEHLVQPMGIGCFSVWFKLEEVNDPNSNTPLACGQYLMLRRDAFFKVGGQERVKNEVVEDLILFKIMKEAGFRCELAIGTHLFATRMYRNFTESWIGWRRIYLHGLQKNVPSLIQKFLMLIFFSFLPFAILAFSAWELFAVGSAEWNIAFALSGGLVAFILFLRSRSHRALQASQWAIFLHPLSALVIAGILLDCLYHLFSDKKVIWKSQQY